MKRLVNGREVELGAAEEAAVRAEWAASSTPELPEVVGRFGLRAAFIELGHMQRVKEVIATLPTQQRERALNEFEHRPQWRRTTPLVVQLANLVPLSAQQLDEVFKRAASADTA